MKKTIVLTILFLAITAFTNVSAQVIPPPAGAGDKDLNDGNIKGRSIELERIDRDAKKEAGKKKNKSAQNPATEQPEDNLAAKYEEIKTDFEQIQQSEDAIIKAYKSGEKIDYSQIGKFSSELNKSAIRLNSNLFPTPSIKILDTKKVENSDAKQEVKTEKETKTTKSVRDIIIDLDNTIGSFAASSMFQNLRAVDPAISEKNRLDLEKIIEMSELLNAEARKMITAGQ